MSYKTLVQSFVLSFIYGILSCSYVTAQTFVSYKDSKFNEFKKGQKVGQWRLQNPNGDIKVEGTIVDNNTLKDVVYSENNKVFARQPNDSTILLLIDGKMKTFEIRRLERISQTVLLEDGVEPKLPLPYKVQFIDENGLALDSASVEAFVNKMHFTPYSYDYLKKYHSNLNVTNVHNISPSSGRFIVNVSLDVNGEVKNVKHLSGPNNQMTTAYIRMVRGFPRWQPQFFLGKFEPAEYPYVLQYKFSPRN